MPQFRKDPVVDRWVIIAGERGQRPQEDFSEDGSGRLNCPLCAGNEAMTPPAVLVLSENSAVQDAPWAVRVVPNKYPALQEHGVYALQNNSLYISAEAAGVHEVVIESPKHITEFSALSAAAIERLLHAYRERIRCLRADGRWQYALIYKNQGREAGATLSHSHSQITALPMVPPEIRHEVDAAGAYYAANGRCIYCDLLARERADGARLILDTGRYIAVCPFAARVAGETWIMPSRHSSSFDLIDASELGGLAALLRDFFGRLGTRFEQPAFNFFIHSNPLQEPENPAYHWYLVILPKLQSTAGFEWGSGMYMNSLAPEDAARRFRER